MITLSPSKRSQLFTLAVLLSGAGILLYFPLLKACAARPQNIAAPLPYFPPGAVWTQDISQAPLDPRSSVMINWLADAGGWDAEGCRSTSACVSCRQMPASVSSYSSGPRLLLLEFRYRAFGSPSRRWRHRGSVRERVPGL